jgi:hypothetical protein
MYKIQIYYKGELWKESRGSFKTDNITNDEYRNFIWGLGDACTDLFIGNNPFPKDFLLRTWDPMEHGDRINLFERHKVTFKIVPKRS